MYISRLSIKNYRNFEEFETDLRPFTLIIGENNSGKTNLLEALGLIFSQEISAFRKRILELDDINYRAVQRFKYSVANKDIAIRDIAFPEVMVEASMTDFDDYQEAVVGDWFTDTGLIEAKLTYTFHLRDNWNKREEWLKEQRAIAEEKGFEYVEFPIKEYEYSIYGGGETSNRADQYLLRMLKMDFLDALRDAKRELVASGDYRLLYKVLINRDDKHFSDIKKFLFDLQILIREHPELQKIEAGIKTYLDKISLQENDSANTVRFHFTTPEASEILKKLSLIYGDDPIIVERNGLGRNNLLYISLILSHLAGVSVGANHTFFRLIGIEEPEAHLHPHLQHHLAKNIVDILKNENGEPKKELQVILTSHSPYISSKLNIENIYIMYRENNEVSAHRIAKGLPEEGETVKFLKKFLDATNSTMFFARKVVLVEGIAEELLVPRLFELHAGKTLEKIGCSIINVRGVAFKHFLEIIRNGYFIKCVVFTDDDFGKKTENRAEDLRITYVTGSDIIRIEPTEKGTFEKDVIDANKEDQGRNILCAALKLTKPIAGKALIEKMGDNTINVDSFFDEIENYKSEFALNLLEKLDDKHACFAIPEYLKRGFDFILK